ncbi:alpha/beta fold hydrolase [Peristeroidobacter soli]|uniref:alpha/beta fold hydrolase n=1 Tax=Peristeroidobacter soli TaxID=2497877 RepID=UPI00101C2BB7|nr:alpha/beta hydrolase [Peristeroidobacter soli]
MKCFRSPVLIFGLLLASLSTVSAAPAWVRVNDVSLRYELTGNGPDVLVLLPSTGKPLEYWDEILPLLASERRTILTYDLRGIGLSQRLQEPITMQDEVDDLRALLDALKIDKPVMMIGTAFGGSVQMQFAAQFPQRVKGIVNFSPSAQLVGRPPRPVHEPRPAPPADPYAITYPVQLRGNEQRWAKYLAMDASNDENGKHFTERLIYSTPFADVFPKLQCPVLMVATTLYSRRTPESVKELVTHIPKGTYQVIESGHDAPFQTPEMVVPLLQAFLREHGFQ